MSGGSNRPTRQPTARADDAVGYGCPPKATRFKKGESGNPRGRPRGSKNKVPALNEERMKAILLEEAYRTISVRDGEKKVSVPMIQAILRSLAVNALKGQHRAQRLFAELLTMTESQNKALHDEWLQVAITYKLDWEEELAHRAALGITGPEPLPHPDHVIVDLRHGTVDIRGPMTKEEKAKYDMLLKRKQEFEQELAGLQKELATETDAAMRQILLNDIEHDQKILNIISRSMPS